MYDDDHDYWVDLKMGPRERLEHDDPRAAGPWYELGQRVHMAQVEESTPLDTPEDIEARVRELRGWVNEWKPDDLPLYDPGADFRTLWAAFYLQRWAVPPCPAFPKWKDTLKAYVGNDDETRETVVLDLVHRCRRTLTVAEKIVAKYTRHKDPDLDAGVTEDVPATHRFNGKPKGEPLTCEFLAQEYSWTKGYVSRELKESRHKERFRCGKDGRPVYVYEWAKVNVLATNKRIETD